MFGISVIPLWAKALGVAIILAVVAGGGYKVGYDVRDYAAQKDTVAAQAAQKKALDELVAKNTKLEHDYASQSAQLQTALTTTHTVVRYVNRSVSDEIAKNPIYHTCVLPKSGVQVIIDSATKLNAVRGEVK